MLKTSQFILRYKMRYGLPTGDRKQKNPFRAKSCSPQTPLTRTPMRTTTPFVRPKSNSISRHLTSHNGIETHLEPHGVVLALNRLDSDCGRSLMVRPSFSQTYLGRGNPVISQRIRNVSPSYLDELRIAASSCT